MSIRTTDESNVMRVLEQERGKVAGVPEIGDFFCPECGSFEVEEIGYDDDFGSMACKACGYQGDPGEDFPALAAEAVWR